MKQTAPKHIGFEIELGNHLLETEGEDRAGRAASALVQAHHRNHRTGTGKHNACTAEFDGNGVRFYRDLRENEATKHIPVIVITGISDDFQKFISSRKQVPAPEGYISKPIEPQTLLDTVAKVLGND